MNMFVLLMVIGYLFSISLFFFYSSRSSRYTKKSWLSFEDYERFQKKKAI